MPLIAMFMKAEMEGVDKLVFPEEDAWKVDIQQSGGTEIREGEDVPNSKGTANFLIKWDGAKAPSSISLVTPTRSTPLKDRLRGDQTVKDKPLLQYSEAGTMQPVAIFDCRGAEPVKWYPIGLVVETSWGRFENVDLSDPDGWMECSETGDTAAISEVQFEFRVVK
eukprot:g11174.t1